MGYPVIQYVVEVEGVGPTYLAFTYPHVQKPFADDREAFRNDSLSESGRLQCITTRPPDQYKIVQMDFVPWEDMPAWADFMDFALNGGFFVMFMDAADPTDMGTSCQMSDTNFNPKQNGRTISKFAMKLRKVVQL